MNSRHSILAMFALLLLPAISSAGPIRFELTQTGYWVDPTKPILESALVLNDTAGFFAFDPASGTPTVIEVFRYDPSRIPQPRPIDIAGDGHATWNNDGYFSIDLRLTDTASGEYADFSVWGRAHAYNAYSNGHWDGMAYFWFGATLRVTLGDNDYVIWGPAQYTTELPAVSVWCGPDAPAPHAPEPATCVLAAIALAPLTLRRLWGR